QYVESVEVINGRLDLRFGYRADHAISGRTLSLTPFETATHEVVWVCGNARPGAGLEPLGFSLGGQQAVQADTLIEPRYLPSTCR
ncbi:MAG TPA: pilin, partial [Gammaproteobacteria bacterium]|nr:pilin [Gammaproteobacteria bacterium]